MRIFGRIFHTEKPGTKSVRGRVKTTNATTADTASQSLEDITLKF